MLPEDHKKTSSHGSQPGSEEYREMIGDMINSGDMRGAMATEIRDVRRVAREAGDPTRYNKAMRQMMRQAKDNGVIVTPPRGREL